MNKKEKKSNTKEQTSRILEGFLDANEEGDRFAAIDDPVVAAHGHLHPLRDDRLTVFHHHPFLDLAHGQDPGLLQALAERRIPVLTGWVAAKAHGDDMVRFLRDMIAIPSESAEEGAVIARIKQEMEKVGAFDRIEVDGLRGDVIRYGLLTTTWVLGKPTGSEKMQKIAAAIQEGAQAYMNRQYSTIAVVGVVLFLVVGLALDWATAVGFAIGAVFSGMAGYIGLFVSVDDYIYNPGVFEELGVKSQTQNDLQFSFGLGTRF